MTANEYAAALDEQLDELPPEFHDAVKRKAWDGGHAYGYEEVLTHAADLVEMLREPIAAYTRRVTNAPAQRASAHP